MCSTISEEDEFMYARNLAKLVDARDKAAREAAQSPSVTGSRDAPAVDLGGLVFNGRAPGAAPHAYGACFDGAATAGGPAAQFLCRSYMDIDGGTSRAQRVPVWCCTVCGWVHACGTFGGRVRDTACPLIRSAGGEYGVVCMVSGRCGAVPTPAFGALRSDDISDYLDELCSKPACVSTIAETAEPAGRPRPRTRVSMQGAGPRVRKTTSSNWLASGCKSAQGKARGRRQRCAGDKAAAGVPGRVSKQVTHVLEKLRVHAAARGLPGCADLLELCCRVEADVATWACGAGADTGADRGVGRPLRACLDSTADNVYAFLMLSRDMPPASLTGIAVVAASAAALCMARDESDGDGGTLGATVGVFVQTLLSMFRQDRTLQRVSVHTTGVQRALTSAVNAVCTTPVAEKTG